MGEWRQLSPEQAEVIRQAEARIEAIWENRVGQEARGAARAVKAEAIAALSEWRKDGFYEVLAKEAERE